MRPIFDRFDDVVPGSVTDQKKRSGLTDTGVERLHGTSVAHVVEGSIRPSRAAAGSSLRSEAPGGDGRRAGATQAAASRDLAAPHGWRSSEAAVAR
jgi:hypothetical protein